MTSVPEPIRRNRPIEVEMRVSRYDQVAGMLVSLLILIGCAVGIMFVIWLTMTLVFRQAAVPIKLIENAAGRGDNPPGFERDMLAPGMEEMPELAEPQLEAALEAVTSAVSSVAASTDVLNTASSVTSKGEGGRGDSRPPGPEGEGDNIIPRWERWEVRWVSTGIPAYARQLDFFKIELGAGGGSPLMDYAYDLSKSPKKRQGTSKAEKRLYMTWKGGTLQQFDRTLLGRVGIGTNNRIMFQFYPEEVEDRLAWIEKVNADKLGHLSVKEYLKTIFGVKAKGSQYEFFVAEQRFRPAPP
ncbi:MAG: hypothetical protein QGG71_08875 [Pirellulaceae bacterium]|nr:hypothetical protein [Pirellulaceae bacterium]